VLLPLDDTRGPYTRLDSSGYQILLDYHGGSNPFPIKSIGEIMRSDDAAALVSGRVIIVGVNSESVHDSFSTPFNTGFNSEDQMNGIVVHAYVADQLIREAMDGAPILDGFPRRLENLWIWAWAMAGMALGLLVRYTIPALIVSAVGLLVLAGIVYEAFGAAVLLPACPAAIAWIAFDGTDKPAHAHREQSRPRAVAQELRALSPPAVITQMLASDSLPKLGVKSGNSRSCSPTSPASRRSARPSSPNS
jgi:CHASE2 domain-containing sensor protein